MPQLTTPQAIAAVLPLVATMLSSWLAQDRLPRWANAAIALLALLGTAIACVALAGNFTGNAQASILGVLGYVAILMNGDLSTLYRFLVALPGPLSAALLPPTTTTSPPAATAVESPQPIQFPPPSMGG